MELGPFSVSLTVKDLQASREFYEKLGFEMTGGDESQNWLIMKHGDAKIGLFHGMFDHNILTFNPPDVRSIQNSLKDNGVELIHEVDESSEGPGHCTLKDPDGNMILLDQF